MMQRRPVGAIERGRLLQPGAVAADNGDVSPCLGEDHGGLGADALRAAGHDGALAFYAKTLKGILHGVTSSSSVASHVACARMVLSSSLVNGIGLAFMLLAAWAFGIRAGASCMLKP